MTESDHQSFYIFALNSLSIPFQLSFHLYKYSVIASRRQLIAWTTGACLCCPTLLPSLAAVSTPPQVKNSSQEWRYGGPEGVSQWPGVCKTGKYQSPIDIPLSLEENSKNATSATTSSSLGVLHFRYPTFVKEGATIRNNGHGSPQINFPPGFDLELGDKTLSLIQMHFHTPSEHTFSGGQHFPIECHLVHRDNSTKQLVVVAILMKLGNTANPVLQTALQFCPPLDSNDADGKASGNGAVPLKKALTLRALLPPPRGTSGGRRYATYEGSLTTPPCTEHVRWVVLLDYVTVTAQQVLDLMAIGGAGKDWRQSERPLQPLNKRKIEYTL